MVALASLCAGGADAQPVLDFSVPAFFTVAAVPPTGDYYSGGLAVGDFTGATSSTIDGFLDVAVYSGPVYDWQGGNPPQDPWSSKVTLFRNTQNWAGASPGLAPINSLIPYLTQTEINICNDCFAGEMQLVDMDGDGTLDIVATSTDLFGVGSVHVWLYNSVTHTFAKKIDFSFNDGSDIMNPVQAFGVGDFTGDGINDLVVSTHRYEQRFGTGNQDQYDVDTVYRLVNVFENGSFGALARVAPDQAVTATPNAPDPTPGDIVVGEFNKIMGFPGAVRPDFVTAEPGVIGLTVGTGAGNFFITLKDQPTAFNCGNASSFGNLVYNDMAVGNVNAGSSDDIVAVLPNTANPCAYVLLGNERGRLTPACDNGVPIQISLARPLACGSPPPENFPITFVDVGQVNDDTYLDIIATIGPPSGDRYVAIALGNGDGTFDIDPSDCSHWYTYSTLDSDVPIDQVVSADMNNDGKDDILVTDSFFATLVVFRNDL